MSMLLYDPDAPKHDSNANLGAVLGGAIRPYPVAPESTHVCARLVFTPALTFALWV
jgi:hypothetical protein